MNRRSKAVVGLAALVALNSVPAAGLPEVIRVEVGVEGMF